MSNDEEVPVVLSYSWNDLTVNASISGPSNMISIYWSFGGANKVGKSVSHTYQFYATHAFTVSYKIGSKGPFGKVGIVILDGTSGSTIKEVDKGDGHTISREAISNLFYDSLHDTYRDSVVLVSKRGDVPDYVNIKINDGQVDVSSDWIPLYNNKPLTFHESLTKCIDGVRSRDIFFFGEEQSNTIEIDHESSSRCKATIVVDYDEYKGIYLYKWEDEDEDE